MRQFSVTEVLGHFVSWDAIPPHVIAHAGERGSWVHKACSLIARDLPVMDVRDESWMGYVHSFKAWFEQYVQHVWFSEKRVFDRALGFHGQPDLGVKLMGGKNVIVDMKTPAVESMTWRGQLAAYLHLMCLPVNHGGIRWDGCMSLMLRPDGRAARAVTYQETAEDFVAFTNALFAVRHFKS